MAVDRDFAEFLTRLRAGDEQAAEELAQKYLPVIRREVRQRLHHSELCRWLDSMDICQSVLASFLLRAAAGQYDVHHPRALMRLLVRMARNKLATHARKFRLSLVAGSPESLELVASSPSPSQVIAGRDLLCEVLNHLSDEERSLAELRCDGLSWPQVASSRGGTAESRRKQLARALDRVVRQLQLEMDF
jgi:RNA polymerase sigma-70 factor (ECF subfamily)